MRIFVFALEGVFDTGLTVLLDAFAIANSLSEKMMGGTPHFDVTTVGMRRTVRTAHGLAVPVEVVKPASKPDWVILPAVFAETPETLMRNLERADVTEAMAQLYRWRRRGVKIGAACMGTFVLAEAGLLDGQEATTNWPLSSVFRQRYPQVQVDETRMVVPCETGVTAGSAMGHLDLALWLVRQSSPELANTLSRYLLADARPRQAPYIIPTHLAQSDPMILGFERWSREHLKDGFSLQDAAKALATTARTLQRRCDAVLGKSPLAYFQDLRVEHAQTLLQRDGHDVEAVATEVGYADGATLRSLLRDKLGRGVREIRAGA